jgi:transposase
MWQELQRVGIGIAEPTVRALVRTCRQRAPEAFVPLTFRPGERAEFDFGHALVELAGVEQQVPYLAGRLRYSGAIYLECFPTERQECFLVGQRHAFEFWGGVPQQALPDYVARHIIGVLCPIGLCGRSCPPKLKFSTGG